MGVSLSPCTILDPSLRLWLTEHLCEQYNRSLYRDNLFMPPTIPPPYRQILAKKLWLLDIQALVEWESPEVLQQQQG